MKPTAADRESIRRSELWIAAHGHEYRMQWIVVRNGELIAHAPRLVGIREYIGWPAITAKIFREDAKI
jgi:hypothetical protein